MSSNKSPIFTNTTIRNSAWISGVIIVLYFLFNLFTYIILDNQLEERLDQHISHEIEHIMNAFYFDNDSLIITNPNEFEESDLVTLTESPFFLQVYSEAKELFLRSENLKEYPSIPYEIIQLVDDSMIFANLELAGEVLRCGYTRIVNKQGEVVAILQLSTPKAQAHVISRNIVLFNIITFPLVFLIIVAVSVFIARKSYTPINNIIKIANTISTGNIDSRLKFKADPRDEIGRLRDTLNNLFDRLEHQINQITQFTDNASHQLMTPLTIMNTELEFIQKKYQNTECADSLDIIEEQTHRMIHIIKTLLILSKDCKDCTDTRSVFSIKRLIEDDVKIIFKLQNVTFDPVQDVLIRGNKDYFSMALQNLINNALKYSPKNKVTKVRTNVENSHVSVIVEDQGKGISSDDRDRIFERFYRGSGDASIPGFGLGLSLVSSIVRAMNGTVNVKDNKPQGTIFTLTLPQLQTD